MWGLLFIIYISLLDTPNLFTQEVDYDECHESCNGCWMAENSHACIKCAEGYYRRNGYCINLNPFEIPGYGRDCVKCPPENYAVDGTCLSCDYGCEECDADGCIQCKTDFRFVMGENGKCTCGLGILRNGVCFCSEKGYFLDENLKCNKCNFTTRSKSGCVSDCPSGYYDVIGQNCEKCHFSCKECTGSTNYDCIEKKCNTDKGFVWVEEQNSCLCRLNAIIEYENICKCIKGYKDVNGECKPDESE